MPVSTIAWHNDKIRMIDQTRLPAELVYLDIIALEVLGEAIKSLRVRGAPALGVAGAFGVLLSAQRFRSEDKSAFFAHLDRDIAYLRATRPTAVNLGWALDRMKRVLETHRAANISAIKAALHTEADRIFEEDRRTCRALAEHGATLVPQEATVITHCNTGALATADFGTAPERGVARVVPPHEHLAFGHLRVEGHHAGFFVKKRSLHRSVAVAHGGYGPAQQHLRLVGAHRIGRHGGAQAVEERVHRIAGRVAERAGVAPVQGFLQKIEVGAEVGGREGLGAEGGRDEAEARANGEEHEAKPPHSRC